MENVRRLRLLAERAGVDVGEIGLEPSVLRRLAPALGLHRSDLFIIAGQPVPDDLAPLDPAASGHVGGLAWTLIYRPDAIPELREFIRALPQQPRPAEPRPAPSYHRYPDGPDALIVQLLHNRNLDWNGATKCLYGLGGVGPLSAATIGVIGRGRKTLTPDLVAGFAAVLGMPVQDLGALTGVDVTGAGQRAVPEAAALLWEARRLTAAQVADVNERAWEIRDRRSPP